MTTPLQVFDDFASNPVEIRERALALDYGPQEHDGHSYDGVGLGYDPNIQPNIEQAIGRPIKVNFGFFRLGMTGVKMSGFIHADANCGKYAGVLYLNLPYQQLGGTSFWRHLPSMRTSVPERLSDGEANQLRKDGLDESLWERTAHVEMQFNRFITYPTAVFHSRYPNETVADTKSEGRLIYAVFYDL